MQFSLAKKKKKAGLNTVKKVCMGSKKTTKTLFFAIIGLFSIFVSKTNESGWK
jgi:hypothetical protein